MQNEEKKISVFQSVLLLVIVMAMILWSVSVNINIVLPLLFGWGVVYIFTLINKKDFTVIFNAGLDSLRKAAGAMILIMVVGVLVSAFISAGTLQSFIYYGLRLIHPSYFLIGSFIILSLMTMAIGTTFGSVASVGIAIMGIGRVLGIPDGLTAATILSGAQFGNRLTPIADTPILTSTLTGGDMFKHIKYQLWTAVPSAIIPLIIYYFLGMQYGGNDFDSPIVSEVLSVLEANTNISVITLLPFVVLIGLMAAKVQAIPSVLGGIVTAALIAYFYQGEDLVSILRPMLSGHQVETGNYIVNQLLNQGGLYSMTSSVFTIIVAVIFGGMIEKLGVINSILSPIVPKLKTRTSLTAMVILTEYFVNMAASASHLGHIITAEFFVPIFKERNEAPEMLSRAMADGMSGSMFFPWHNMTIFFTGVLGVTWGQYMPYMYMIYLIPIFNILSAKTGIGWLEKEQEDTVIIKGEEALNETV